MSVSSTVGSTVKSEVKPAVANTNTDKHEVNAKPVTNSAVVITNKDSKSMPTFVTTSSAIGTEYALNGGQGAVVSFENAIAKSQTFESKENVAKKDEKQELPQMGEKSSVLKVIGATILLILSTLGLSFHKKFDDEM